jgi:hypothetical protein
MRVTIISHSSLERAILTSIRLGMGLHCRQLIDPRKETPCRIEPSFPLPRLPSLASRVFRLMPWRIEAQVAWAALMWAASIAAAAIAEAMRAVALGWALAPLPSVQR